MKRILTTLLALAMLIGCVAVFASCGGNQGPKPKLDLEKVEDVLEDEDTPYLVLKYLLKYFGLLKPTI